MGCISTTPRVIACDRMDPEVERNITDHYNRKVLAKFSIVLDGANFLIENPPSPSAHADRILALIGVV